jgi:hypothetical protein
MNDNSKITGYYSDGTYEKCPIQIYDNGNGKFYMHGGTITGNTVGTASNINVIRAKPATNAVIDGGVIMGNTDKNGSAKNGVSSN